MAIVGAAACALPAARLLAGMTGSQEALQPENKAR
jgi:hypothetical protein